MEFLKRIQKKIKILKFNVRTKKIIIVLKLHARIITNLEISLENNENIENHRIPCDNYEIH